MLAYTRVARYPVFQGSSRISAPISHLPGRSYPGDEISRISIRTCQSPVTTHYDTLYGPCIVTIAYTTTMQIMHNSTVNTEQYSEHSEPVASIQIYFEGAKLFPSQGGGQTGRNPRPERPRTGMLFLGGAASPLSTS